MRQGLSTEEVAEALRQNQEKIKDFIKNGNYDLAETLCQCNHDDLTEGDVFEALEMSSYAKEGQCLHGQECSGTCKKKFVMKYTSNKSMELRAGQGKNRVLVCHGCKSHPWCVPCFAKKRTELGLDKTDEDPSNNTRRRSSRR